MLFAFVKKQKNVQFRTRRGGLVLIIPFLLLSLVGSIFVSPPKVDAALTGAQLDAQAKKRCETNGFGGGRLEYCVKGYKWGYNGDPSDSCQKEYPAANKIRENAACSGGYKFGSDDRLKENPNDNPDSPQQQTAAQAFCANYKPAFDDGEKSACERGYKERLKNNPISVCSGLSGDNFRACEIGWKHVGEIKLDTQATDACTDKFRGDTTKINSCKAGYKGKKEGKTQAESCRNAANKDACGTGFVLAGGTVSEDEERVDPDCSSSLKSILSWIACPIIDMGASFTDFVFKDFVRPMLENVPISAKPGEPGYTAWQGFRLLGNLLLVGTLLAVVYGQTRGGGGGR